MSHTDAEAAQAAIQLWNQGDGSGGEDKVGLALSGGGFRAAFFHVGVLTSLAERGYLQRVEVISTVSGGSIVGSLYYLLLKRELESRPDGEVDYCAIVEELEEKLRKAVRTNIRARVFANPWKNARMASRGYSRSHRIGDLYDRLIYKGAWSRPDTTEQVKLRELRIHPLDANGNQQKPFHPNDGNQGRKNRVPVLMINATTLNSGHPWRFEAIRMGEPYPDNPETARILRDVDKNVRFEQGYFEEPTAAELAKDPGRDRFEEPTLRDFPLGVAVAASAAVPGVFQPVTIRDGYRDVSVQLVDGGVQDNLGISGLIDRDCTHLIISDGSAQMEDEARPVTRIPAVLGRSRIIPRDGIREEQILRAHGGNTRAIDVMHLRKGIQAKRVPPIGGGRTVEDSEREQELSTSDFGVHQDVQVALSQLRTDLDFFSRVEVSSLELDGYLMTKQLFPSAPERWENVRADSCSLSEPRTFDEVACQIDRPTDDYLKLLEIGKARFARPVRLPGPARWLVGAGAASVVMPGGYFVASDLTRTSNALSRFLKQPITVGRAALVGALMSALGILYRAKNRFSRAFFTLAGWIVIPLTAFPLSLRSWAQLLFLPFLRPLDRVPPAGPAGPRQSGRKVLSRLTTTERSRMATKDDFNTEEWEAISDGPVYAGLMIITASEGGTIRETFSMSKAWAEARQRHGESELLDAIAAEKPKLDEKPGSAIELHNAGLQMLRQAVDAIKSKSPDELDAYQSFVTGLAERTAEAHEEHGEKVSPGERSVLDEIAEALGTGAQPSTDE